MTDPLAVWLHGIHVADVRQLGVGRYRLRFSDEAVGRFRPRSPALSLSLPVTDRRINDPARVGEQRPVAAFLEGLLPEGNLRQQLSARWGVSTGDSLGLLAHVGRECAGAVQFLPDGERPRPGRLRPLSSGELDSIVASLPTYQLPSGTELHASLAGLQDKVLVTRTEAGWAWPEEGAASSHLIKPDPGTQAPVQDLIGWEHWSQQVAARAGLPAAVTRVESFGGRRALVIARYDRTADGERIHQEDICQALGLPPQAKYETTAEARSGGSRLQRVVVAAAPFSADPTRFREQLLQRVTFNVAVGNADAHAKNYSLLIDHEGGLSWAPVYDTAPLLHLNPNFHGSGLVIAGKAELTRISADDLADEAVSWGLPRRLAEHTVHETWDRAVAAARTVDPPTDSTAVLEGMERAWRQHAWAGEVPAAVDDHRAADGPPADDHAGQVWVEPHQRAGRPVRGYWRRR